MLFSSKPTKDKVLNYYTSLDKTFIASIWINEWEYWFGTIQPFVEEGLVEHRGDNIGYVSIPKLDCVKVIPIQITAAWNDLNQIIGLNVSANN